MLAGLGHAEIPSGPTLPLAWAVPENRLVFNITLRIQSAWLTSTSRIDLGSGEGMMLPTKDCVTSSCSHCANSDCKCAPSDVLLVPSRICPDGSRPSLLPNPAKNGRIYHTCRSADVDVMLGGSQLTLKGSDLTQVLYMTKVARCDESDAAKTGFNGAAPFLRAIYNQVGTHVFSISQTALQLTFGGEASNAGGVKATTRFEKKGSGGRVVKIVAVNGNTVENVVAAIDTGNDSFLSYGPGSPLEAAAVFPFSITFDGGDTLTFASAPSVNGKKAQSIAYSHNVLALGFMAPFKVTFDDAKRFVYFSSESTSGQQRLMII